MTTSRCEAFVAVDCQDPVAWRVLYHRKCTCWPQEKFFCQSHGTAIAAEWEPPDDEGNCPECLKPIHFVIMEPR